MIIYNLKKHFIFETVIHELIQSQPLRLCHDSELPMPATVQKYEVTGRMNSL